MTLISIKLLYYNIGHFNIFFTLFHVKSKNKKYISHRHRSYVKAKKLTLVQYYQLKYRIIHIFMHLFTNLFFLSVLPSNPGSLIKFSFPPICDISPILLLLRQFWKVTDHLFRRTSLSFCDAFSWLDCYALLTRIP